MADVFFFENVLNEFNIKPSDVSQYPPLVLAYIGDTVYEVYIRTMVLSEGVDLSISFIEGLPSLSKPKLNPILFMRLSGF